MDSDDGISHLHDSILSHILSFLTTKEAVATSILSQAWRFLWTKVPIIDLDELGYCFDDYEKQASTRLWYYVRDVSGLREADLYLPILCYDLDDPVNRKNIFKLVNSLTSVSTLRLRLTESQALEVYKSCKCTVPVIINHAPNLVHLVVACVRLEFLGRICSLQISNPSGILSWFPCQTPINSLRKSKCSDVIYDVPSCLLLRTKVIEIRDFNDSEEAMEKARYLLMNAKVLNKMKVYCLDMPSPMEEMKILRKLHRIPRGSGTCRISICSSSWEC